MATEVIKTVKQSGGNYTSLQNWETGEQRDLVTADEIAVAECYIFSGGDTSPVTITGWTTDATRYIKVYTPTAQRHNGTPQTGYYMTHSSVGEECIHILSTKNVRIEGIAFEITGSPANSRGIYQQGNGDGVQISECVSRGGANGFLVGAVAGETLKIKNCLAINTTAGGFAHGTTFPGSVYMYNCTAVDCNNGVWFGSQDTPANKHIKNCLSTGSAAGDFIYTAGMDVDYNASGDATADDLSAGNNRINQTFTFVASASDNFHLAAGDAGAKDFGVDLSADANYPFSNDIDGDTRSGSWDIGFDEYVAAAPGGGGGGIAGISINRVGNLGLR